MRHLPRTIVALGALVASLTVVLPTLSATPREKRLVRTVVKAPSLRPAVARSTASLLVSGVQFGAPLPGLTTAQRVAFDAGAAEFVVNETPASGLGPVMNNRSCISCHGQPAIGGGSGIRVTRFGRTTNGVFDALDALGGSLLQQNSIDPAIVEVVPGEANTVARRQSTPLYGMGLVEAIPDEAILAGAERQRALGLNGVPHLVVDVADGRVRVGRFGWKAQQATVVAFSADAYLNEMGITNRLFPTENAPNGNTALLAQFDRVRDPEDVPNATGLADFERVADFMRFLAPPPTLPLTASAVQGRTLFSQVGCAGCHTPKMMTGPHAVQALSYKEVELYSDLLLHDMGALGDGIVQGDAGARDFKTQPLWGLRSSGPYLHDGRALTIDQATQAHDGEAATSRDAYRALNATQRQQLLDFLGSI